MMIVWRIVRPLSGGVAESELLLKFNKTLIEAIHAVKGSHTTASARNRPLQAPETNQEVSDLLAELGWSEDEIGKFKGMSADVLLNAVTPALCKKGSGRTPHPGLHSLPTASQDRRIDSVLETDPGLL